MLHLEPNWVQSRAEKHIIIMINIQKTSTYFAGFWKLEKPVPRLWPQKAELPKLQASPFCRWALWLQFYRNDVQYKITNVCKSDLNYLIFFPLETKLSLFSRGGEFMTDVVRTPLGLMEYFWEEKKTHPQSIQQDSSFLLAWPKFAKPLSILLLFMSVRTNRYK